MSGKRSLSFWFGLSVAIVGVLTVLLEVYLATYGKEDIIAGVLQIPMALILLALVIGLLVTRRERQIPTEASKAVCASSVHSESSQRACLFRSWPKMVFIHLSQCREDFGLRICS
jgi:hypothetical protein